MDTTDTTDNSHQKVVNDYIKQIARQHEHVTHAREYRGSQIVAFILNSNFTKLQQLDYYFMYRSAIHESTSDHSYYSVYLLRLYIFLIIECSSIIMHSIIILKTDNSNYSKTQTIYNL